MNENEPNVPKLRFPGFTGPWEQRKLGEVAAVNPVAILPDSFEYVDLESVVGTNMVSHRREEKATAPSRAQRLAATGDIFFRRCALIRKTTIYLKCLIKTMFSQRVMRS